MNISEEDTLQDDVWKDSFDKLLDQRQVLRDLNVIKRDVRASYNMNSSFESSSYNSSRLTKLDSDLQNSNKSMQYLDVPQNIKVNKGKKHVKTEVVSTPIKRNIANNPFKCTLSPIGLLDMQRFSSNCRRRNINQSHRIEFNATPINDNVIVNVDYVGDTNTANINNETFINAVQISPLTLVKQKWKSKTKEHVNFGGKYILNNTTEKSNIKEVDINTSQLCHKIELQSGKWQRSLSCYRRTMNTLSEKFSNPETVQKQHRKGRSSIIVQRLKSLATAASAVGNRKSICLRPNSTQARTSLRLAYSLDCNDFKRQILQRCGQRRILAFNSAYNEDYLKNCCKIGEGAFGEVFIYANPKTNHDNNNNNNQKTVLKIIPIEGKQLINGELQKTYEQILPEIIISMELAGLNKDNCRENTTSGFVNLQKVRLVKGKYPSYLQKLWEEYDLVKESENDHPKCFSSNQEYIVLELGFGGQDLESFCFKNAEQSFSALQQIILTLAVGEREYQFEHRDLHWGNVLVINTNQQDISYKLDGEILTVPTKGILITIIDYTLSRMTFTDYCLFNDLSNDEELFVATGDYQFEIYRMMREITNDKWERFAPKTNIFWISYIISKFIEGVKYKSTRSKNHSFYLDKLKELERDILKYESCAQCARQVVSF